MDTGVLSRVLDDILEYGGDYRIDRLDLGQRARGRVPRADRDPRRGRRTAERILMRLQTHGVNQVDPGRR